MFVDASALCSMIANEHDARLFADILETASVRATSPLAVWETAINVSRLLLIEHEAAQKHVEDFLALLNISILPVAPETTAISLEAYRKYGKRRHAANLNFGDCFAYACARHYRMPLLFKGNEWFF